MSDETRSISAEVDPEEYERFQEIKERVDGTNAETMRILIDRFNGKQRPRPAVLDGTSQRIKTGHGKVYVNINHDPSLRPFEVFVTTGDSGGYTNAFTEAVGKLASLSLRAGVDAEEVADALTGIRMPKTGLDRGDSIYSIPDGVGIALLRFLEEPRDIGSVDPIRGATNGEMGVED